MGLAPGRAQNWAADAGGTHAAFVQLSEATKRKRGRDRRGEQNPDEFFES